MAHLEGAELSEEPARRRPPTHNPHRTRPAGPLRFQLQVRRRVQPLLDAVTAYLPSPLDRPPVVGHHPKKGTERSATHPKSPFAASSSRSPTTPTATSRSSGCTRASPRPQLASTIPAGRERDVLEALSHRRRRPRAGPGVEAGDIVGVVGLKDSVTGDTLCDAAHPILLERIEFPGTVIRMSIEPVSSSDKGKLAHTLASLAREDPTFSYKVNEETGQTLISGMGDSTWRSSRTGCSATTSWGSTSAGPGSATARRSSGPSGGYRVVHPADRRRRPLRQGHDRPRARSPAQGGAGPRFVNA